MAQLANRSVAFLCAFILLLTMALALQADPPQVGQSAPPFTLTTNKGQQASLQDFSGKWVVLYFYPRDFTRGCTIEARNFQRDIAQYESKNAVILGVSVDSADSHKDFCAKEGLSFKLLADTEGQVSTAYGSLRDRDGTKFSVRNTFIINPTGTIAKVFLGVRPTPHSEEVLAALTEMQAE